MKTLFWFIIFLLQINYIYPQETLTGSTYSFGTHGIEITIYDPWNFVQENEDWFEILYDCSVDEKCANIQVSFCYEEIGGTINENHEKVIKEYKRVFPDLVYTKDSKNINDFDFHIIDLYAVRQGYFFAQTLATAKTNYEIINFCYTTKKLKFYTKKNMETYIVEKNRLIDVLNTIKVSETQKANEIQSNMVLFNCDDHTTNLLVQKDSLKCCVKLPGNASLRIDGEFVKFDNILVKLFLLSTELIISDNQDFNSDEAILTRFMNAMSSLIYYYSVAPQSKKKNYFYLLPIDSSIHKSAFIWYPYFITKKEWKKIIKSDQGNIPYEVSKYAEVYFVSLLIDDYIFSFQIHPENNQSFNEAKSLLLEIVNSLKYTFNTLGIDDMCPPNL